MPFTERFQADGVQLVSVTLGWAGRNGAHLILPVSKSQWEKAGWGSIRKCTGGPKAEQGVHRGSLILVNPALPFRDPTMGLPVIPSRTIHFNAESVMEKQWKMNIVRAFNLAFKVVKRLWLCGEVFWENMRLDPGSSTLLPLAVAVTLDLAVTLA